MQYCEGAYCPTCQALEAVPGRRAPGAPPSYTARTVTGGHLREGADLAALTEWVRGLMRPGSGDVVLSDGGRVVAVVLNTDAVVRVGREGGARHA
jgi:hypothetical protein